MWSVPDVKHVSGTYLAFLVGPQDLNLGPKDSGLCSFHYSLDYAFIKFSIVFQATLWRTSPKHVRTPMYSIVKLLARSITTPRHDLLRLRRRFQEEINCQRNH